ncbi:MAG: hypothetical protein ACLT3A_07145, partial [Subdoligranulum sp.]
AAAGAVLKPQGGNCAVLPKIIILYQKAQAVPCWGQPEFYTMENHSAVLQIQHIRFHLHRPYRRSS